MYDSQVQRKIKKTLKQLVRLFYFTMFVKTYTAKQKMTICFILTSQIYIITDTSGSLGITNSRKMKKVPTVFNISGYLSSKEDSVKHKHIPQ